MENTVTWVSVVILILATLSFTRAMQRMCGPSLAERTWREAAVDCSTCWPFGGTMERREKPDINTVREVLREEDDNARREPPPVPAEDDSSDEEADG